MNKLFVVFALFLFQTTFASTGGNANSDNLNKIDDRSKSVVNKVTFTSSENQLMLVEKSPQNPLKKKKNLRVNASEKLEQDDFKRLEQELELLNQ